MKTAVITGASGQDAYYLSRLLLSKGYRVIATERRVARPQADTVIELLTNRNYQVVDGDVTDMSAIVRVIKEFQPDEFYHLAAQSEVGTSFKQPISTCDITGMGTVNCLEAIRITKPNTRFYFAGSSEQFGDTHFNRPLDENAAMLPRSPYAASKIFGHDMTSIYRKSYDMFACCGILFNHESPHRKPYFVTRKITMGVAAIHKGLRDSIALGNIDSCRDWGHSADYMRAAWMMLQHDIPDDYVVATGRTHSIRDLLTTAFEHIGIHDWSTRITIDERFFRPNDVTKLIGDSSKIRATLGWKPEYTFDNMIKEMVEYDCRRIGSPLIATR